MSAEDPCNGELLSPARPSRKSGGRGTRGIAPARQPHRPRSTLRYSARKAWFGLLWLLGLFELAACATTPATPATAFAQVPVAPGVLARFGHYLAKPIPTSYRGLSGLLATSATDPGELTYTSFDARVSHWSMHFASDTRPVVLGDLAIVTQGRTLSAIDVTTGKLKFASQLPNDQFVGATRSGGRVFIVTREGESHGTLRCLHADSGEPCFERKIAGHLGRPASAGQLVIVPSQGQTLWGYDAQSGASLGSVRTVDDVWSFVRLRRDAIIVGDSRSYRISEGYDGTLASALGPSAAPPTQIPGRPRLHPSDFQTVPARPSAHGRIALHGSPGRSLWYFNFFKHVYAFDRQGRLRWARALASDIARATTTDAGLLVATVNGRIQRLAARDGTGQSLATASHPIGSATFVLTTPASGSRPGAADSTPDAMGTDSLPSTRLATDLERIIKDTDTRLLPSRAFALLALADLPSPEVTAALVALIGQSTLPAELRVSAADALRRRTTGHSHLLRALQGRYDFLEQRAAPPLWALSPAVATLGLQEAVPLLRRHLFDHETPLAALVPVARALMQLAPARGAAAVTQLIARHRSDGVFVAAPEQLEALASLAMTGAPDSLAPTLSTIANYPGTAPTNAAIIAAVLQSAVHTGASRQSGKPVAPNAVPRPERQPAAAYLDRFAVARAYAAHSARLRPCMAALRQRQPALRSVRIITRVTAAGTAKARHYLPDDAQLVACLDRQLVEQTFDPTRSREQLVTYVVDVADGRPIDRSIRSGRVAFADRQRNTAWWHGHVMPARGAPNTTDPWWLDKNPMVISSERGYRSTDVRKAALAVDAAPVDNGAASTQAVTPWWTTQASGAESSPRATPRSSGARKLERPASTAPNTSKTTGRARSNAGDADPASRPQNAEPAATGPTETRPHGRRGPPEQHQPIDQPPKDGAKPPPSTSDAWWTPTLSP